MYSQSNSPPPPPPPKKKKVFSMVKCGNLPFSKYQNSVVGYIVENIARLLIESYSMCREFILGDPGVLNIFS